ncbi:MAG: transposase, partial [Raineya sp.]
MEYKEYYRRHLPHIQPIGGTFFVTYCLYGSLPKEVFIALQEEYEREKQHLEKDKKTTPKQLDDCAKRYFLEVDKQLDGYPEGNHYLKDPRLAAIVAQTLHFWDNKKLELYAYCIMSNHVHTVFRLYGERETPAPYTLDKIMQSIKSFSGKKCNEILRLSGKFWQEESYDRLVRNDTELRNILIYVLNNPVKASLCKEMKDWAWSY